MKIIYSNELPYQYDVNGKSAFLCGPTPRSPLVPSWRPTAVEILEKVEFDGTVLIPEASDGTSYPDFLHQVEWEYSGLHNCEVIVIWVPRNMENMLALTTNVEFGYWLASTPNKVLYGRPDGAPHTGYLDWLYEKRTGRKPDNKLDELLHNAVDFLG